MVYLTTYKGTLLILVRSKQRRCYCGQKTSQKHEIYSYEQTEVGW